jgi:hypothetical protein
MDYLLPIFTDAIGSDDVEAIRQSTFSPGKLGLQYQSTNTDFHKRIRYLPEDVGSPVA